MWKLALIKERVGLVVGDNTARTRWGLPRRGHKGRIGWHSGGLLGAGRDVGGTSVAREGAGFPSEEEAVRVVATVCFVGFWLGHQPTVHPPICMHA